MSIIRCFPFWPLGVVPFVNLFVLPNFSSSKFNISIVGAVFCNYDYVRLLNLSGNAVVWVGVFFVLWGKTLFSISESAEFWWKGVQTVLLSQLKLDSIVDMNVGDV